MVWSVGLRCGRSLTARGLFSLPPRAGARHVALGAEWRDGKNDNIQPRLTRVQQATLLGVNPSPRGQPTLRPQSGIIPGGGLTSLQAMWMISWRGGVFSGETDCSPRLESRPCSLTRECLVSSVGSFPTSPQTEEW